MAWVVQVQVCRSRPERNWYPSSSRQACLHASFVVADWMDVRYSSMTLPGLGVAKPTLTQGVVGLGAVVGFNVVVRAAVLGTAVGHGTSLS